MNSLTLAWFIVRLMSDCTVSDSGNQVPVVSVAPGSFSTSQHTFLTDATVKVGDRVQVVRFNDGSALVFINDDELIGEVEQW